MCFTFVPRFESNSELFHGSASSRIEYHLILVEEFSEKYSRLLKERRTLLVLGLDPHLSVIKEDFKDALELNEEILCFLASTSLIYYLSDDKVMRLLDFLYAGKGDKETSQSLVNFLRFCALAIYSLKDDVIGVKFQSACFERLGVYGSYCLSVLMELARRLDLLVLFDGKRGDIEITLSTYAEAYFSSENLPFSMEADAITLNPFIGIDTWNALIPYLKNGKQVFFIAYPSSPSASDFAEALVCGTPIYMFLASSARDILIKNRLDSIKPSPIGFVIGANKPEVAISIRSAMPDALFLVPGIGAQGVKLADVAYTFTSGSKLALFPISRALLYSYKTKTLKGVDGRQYQEIITTSVKDTALLFNTELRSTIEL